MKDKQTIILVFTIINTILLAGVLFYVGCPASKGSCDYSKKKAYCPLEQKGSMTEKAQEHKGSMAQ